MYLTRHSTRNNRGSIAEFGPAMFIGVAVMFFIIGFGFYLCGVSTAYFACQLASREGATGGSRSRITAAATGAATRVSTSVFGRFARLENSGGGAFANGVRVRFFQLTPAGQSTEFIAGNVDPANVYQVRVQSNYQVTIPFIGVVRGVAGSDNVIDQPEALAVN